MSPSRFPVSSHLVAAQNVTVKSGNTLVFTSSNPLSIAIGQLDIESGAVVEVETSIHLAVQTLISKNSAATPSIGWSKDNLIASITIDDIQGDLCLDVSANPHGHIQIFYNTLHTGKRISVVPVHSPTNVAIVKI